MPPSRPPPDLDPARAKRPGRAGSSWVPTIPRVSTSDRRRRDVPNPDTPIADRTISSSAMLAQRVHEIARAFRAGDEQGARTELRALASEARCWRRAEPLVMTQAANRARIAIERDPPGCQGSS
jgi:hypothetical protein